MRNGKRVSALLLSVIMLLSLCACGSSRNSSGKSTAQTSMPAQANYQAASYDYATEEATSLAMGDYEADYGFSPVPTPAPTYSSAKNGAESTEAEPEAQDKIIYSSDVTVETTQFDETIGKISGLVEEYGGWIESSSVSGSNYYQKSRGNASTRDASYTLRIPSGRFRELMDSLSGLGNIPYSHIYTENVTSQYYDAQAHLKAYQTQENRLLEMMELAETVEDVIIIEDRLTELRYQIESLQSRLNNWDRRVSYSTIALTVKEVREYTPEEKVNPTYGEELVQALKDGLYNAGQFLKDLLVLLVEALPVLILLVPIIWLAVWLIRKLVKKIAAGHQARKASKRAGKQEKTRKPAAAEPLAAEESGKEE